MKTLFLINPGAGRRRKPQHVAELIQHIYGNAGQDYETWSVNFSRLDEDLEVAKRRGFTRLFVVGGDGTLNAIGTRLIGSDMAMGVIPGGSGNGLGRHLGWPVKLADAIRASLHAQPRVVDTGRIDQHAFLNLAGMGLDAMVAESFSEETKRGLGPYVRHTARGILQMRIQHIELEVEGQWQTFSDVLGLVVANGTQWGFEAKIAAGSSVTDGLLDVRILHRFPLVMTPPLLVRLFNGTLHHSHYLTAFQTPTVRIRRTAPGVAQIDGEPIKVQEEVEVSVQPASLRLLLPSEREI